ncbi:unnamed protein product [Acanthoscelides obtectus]|uniref:Uncharacterized protein n=1 Tax=Acanthoscelides obtectus TaxID=200917 RepID=A0A9P0NYW3_ACAOB|nr:unnamed protein product [Acanthoscelides obtectus]CAK1649363.1 hypothetical protein AOBTE_LOCUS16184 [Acanthoscelides obtectus]
MIHVQERPWAKICKRHWGRSYHRRLQKKVEEFTWKLHETFKDIHAIWIWSIGKTPILSLGVHMFCFTVH